MDPEESVSGYSAEGSIKDTSGKTSKLTSVLSSPANCLKRDGACAIETIRIRSIETERNAAILLINYVYASSLSMNSYGVIFNLKETLTEFT